MKITMYELLGLVKDGKAPKKIKYKNIIYELDDNKIWADEVYSEGGNSYIRLNFQYIKSFNDEVEILEEEKEIPEKIKSNGKEFYCDNIDSWVDKEKTSAYCEYLMNKYNDLIDYLKSKGE